MTEISDEVVAFTAYDEYVQEIEQALAILLQRAGGAVTFTQTELLQLPWRGWFVAEPHVLGDLTLAFRPHPDPVPEEDPDV